MVQNNMQNGNFEKQLYSQLLLIHTSLSSVLLNKVTLRYDWFEQYGPSVSMPLFSVFLI